MTKLAIKNEFPTLADIIRNGQHKGESFKVVELDKGSADLCHQFHTAVIDDIIEQTGEPCKILLPKSKEYFEKHLDRSYGTTIGILADNKIIGLALAHFYQKKKSPDNKDHSIVDMSVQKPDEICVLQSAAVDREYRRNGLQLKLVSGRVLAAKSAGRSQLVSQIEIQNIPSLSNILKSGFQIKGIAHYKTENLWAYNTGADTSQALQRIKNKFNIAAGDLRHDKTIAVATIAKTKNWPKGYKGIGLTKDKKKILLRKNRP